MAYTSTKIAENTSGAIWQVRGLAGENAYIVEGAEKALLIDSTCGAGDIRQLCAGLTSKPLYAALTHGHGDHVGGVFAFNACHIHPDDIWLMWKGSDVEGRRKFVRRHTADHSCPPASGFTPACPLWTFPLYGGAVFNLGGVQVEAIAVPGHTRGTLVFLEKESGILFSGDACNTNTLLNLENSTSITEYRQSLRNLNTRRAGFNTLWGGHGAKPLPPAVIDETLELCEQILAGADAAEEAGSRDGISWFYARDRAACGEFSANIAYRKDWIQEAPHLPVEEMGIDE